MNASYVLILENTFHLFVGTMNCPTAKSVLLAFVLVHAVLRWPATPVFFCNNWVLKNIAPPNSILIVHK